MGFAEVLTLIFVLLKVTHVIDWSWWWVLSPEIAVVVVYLCLLFGFFVTAWEASKAVKGVRRQ